MSNLSIGKKIFDNLVEYPLPAKSGVQDYVFYLVPTSNEYGKIARYFFDRFYKTHQKKDADSLESIVSQLHTEVKSNGVTQIRELVIVTHSNRSGLIARVLSNTSGENEHYKYVSIDSLDLLQRDFNETKFATFSQKRMEVVPYLKNDSWITIRSCNFGYTEMGMYALYSFFGGRANLYALTAYQFFGTHPIGKGMRKESRLQVHEHFVKQRFFPNDLHSPERKDIVVKALVDPARFSKAVVLASMNIDNPLPADMTRYEALIDNLNQRSITGDLKARLAQNDIQPSSTAFVVVKEKDRAWVINDIITHEGENYHVVYDISEEISVKSGKKVTSLLVSASIEEKKSDKEQFLLQLFLDETEHKIYENHLFPLAIYVEREGDDPALETRFKTIERLLDNKKFYDTASGSVNIINLFKDAAADGSTTLSASASIEVKPHTGEPPLERKQWVIHDTTSYLIKMEHPFTTEGFRAHTITVYKFLEGKALLMEKIETASFIGQDPGLPGTELLAYLDRHSLEDLLVFIGYLRANYQPHYAVFIFHAAEAIIRKKEYRTWVINSPEFKDDAAPLMQLPVDLSIGEKEDMDRLVYPYDVNKFWKEVKASNPSFTPINETSDLFEDELLSMRYPAPPNQLSILQESEPDSPYTDRDELRASESRGLDKYSAVEKMVVDAPAPTQLSCEQFGEILQRIKALNTTDINVIKAALGDYIIIPKGTFSDYISDPVNTIPFVLDMIANFEVYTASSIPTVANLARFASGSLSFGLGIFFLFLGTASAMWDIIKLDAQGAANFERLGKIVGIRGWCLKLLDEIIDDTYDNGFPSELKLDYHTPNNAAYYIVYYYKELYYKDSKSTFPYVHYPHDLKRGFDEGWRLMEEAGNDILRKSGSIIDNDIFGKRLNSCEIYKLRNSGLVDFNKVTVILMTELAKAVLQKMPEP